MSTLTVPLTTVKSVKPHPKADRLDIAEIEGWQVIVAKGSMEPGQQVIYVCPDNLVPEPFATNWGVKEYLSKGERVKAVKLRGEPSFGFAVPVIAHEAQILAEGDYKLGDNVAEAFGITKYEPPSQDESRQSLGNQGRSTYEHPLFARYTTIENLRHHPDIFEPSDLVVATEKIHGTNSRIALIDGVRMAGSHKVQRLHPSQVRSVRFDRDHWYHRLGRAVRSFFTTEDVGHTATEQVGPTNPGTPLYWSPWDAPGVSAMLEALSRDHRQVILYGEIYGPKVQKLGYGLDPEHTGYRAFDLLVDGRYLDYPHFTALCRFYGVETVPELYMGPYDPETIKQLSSGKTTINGATHIREGVVVRPIQERRHPKVGRLIMKFVSAEYLTGNFEE